MSHTLGPWFTGTRDSQCKRTVISERGDHVAFCGSFPVEEAIDNARLIEAAPELLEALVALEDQVIALGVNGCAQQLAKARAAIAKAKWES